MSIKSISFGTTSVDNNIKTTNITKKQETKSSPNNKNMKWLPYAAGIALLAVSAYAFRGKISKILKKTPEIKSDINSEINPDIKTEIKTEIKEDVPQELNKKINPDIKENVNPKVSATPNLPAVIQSDILPKPPETFELKPEVKAQIFGKQPYKFNLNLKPAKKTYEKPEIEVRSRFQDVCAGFDKEGKPIYEKIDTLVDSTPARDAFKEALESVDFNNKTIISKIENIRNSESDNIIRILNENTRDGHVDMPMMKKIANDYMLDTNRGENRYHQAADLLEQAHIREFVKGDEKMRSGMYNFTDSVTTDPVLYKCYQNMPLEESANRLNYLKEHDLKSNAYKEGMNADGFFNKAFNRLVEKYQFKRYNEAHGINA